MRTLWCTEMCNHWCTVGY